MLEQLRADVLRIAKNAVTIGLVHEMVGNFSAIDRASGLVAITPTGIPRETLKPGGISVVDLDGNLVEGQHKPSSEWPMHTVVYKAMPGIGAIVHTHSVFATAFAAAGKEIGPVTSEIVRFGGRIPLVPFEVPGTPELGVAAVPFLLEHRAALLEHHGVLAVGRTVDEALMNAVAVEDIAKILVISTAIGGPRLLTWEELASIRE